MICEVWNVYWRRKLLTMSVLWPWPRRYDLESISWRTLGSYSTQLLSMDSNNCVQYYPDLQAAQKLWKGHKFLTKYIYTMQDMTWLQMIQSRSSQKILGNISIKHFYHHIVALTKELTMCILWPWPSKYDLGLRLLHNFGSWIAYHYPRDRSNLMSLKRILSCKKCDLDLGVLVMHYGFVSPSVILQQSIGRTLSSWLQTWQLTNDLLRAAAPWVARKETILYSHVLVLVLALMRQVSPVSQMLAATPWVARKETILYSHVLVLVLALMRQVSPVSQMLASSGVLAMRSMDSKSSPNIMEKAHSSWYIPAISLFFRASVVLPPRTSLMSTIGTENRHKTLCEKLMQTEICL